jgi:thioredoxin 1
MSALATSPCTIPQLDEAAFEGAVVASALHAVVHFVERDCRDCELPQRYLADMLRQGTGRVRWFCIHGEANPASVARYRVSQFPTILVFREGRVARRLVGLPLPGELEVILRCEIAPPAA